MRHTQISVSRMLALCLPLVVRTALRDSGGFNGFAVIASIGSECIPFSWPDVAVGKFEEYYGVLSYAFFVKTY